MFTNRNGRWRSTYTYSPSDSSLTGTIKVDVHYYEDGNVRLLTKKFFNETLRSGATAADIVKSIETGEKKYQQELNRAFGALSEGAFKSLRRQLPVTRQKIDWDKITTYRVSAFDSVQRSSEVTVLMTNIVGARYRWRTGWCKIRLISQTRLPHLCGVYQGES